MRKGLAIWDVKDERLDPLATPVLEMESRGLTRWTMLLLRLRSSWGVHGQPAIAVHGQSPFFAPNSMEAAARRTQPCLHGVQ